MFRSQLHAQKKTTRTEHNIVTLSHNKLKVNIQFLLARLESAYSLIWGAREIWGKGGGETLALL